MFTVAQRDPARCAVGESGTPEHQGEWLRAVAAMVDVGILGHAPARLQREAPTTGGQLNAFMALSSPSRSTASTARAPSSASSSAAARSSGAKRVST